MFILTQVGYPRQDPFGLSTRGTVTSVAAVLKQDRDQLLDSAERLFYRHGIQSVTMLQVRDVAELPLKRIYQLYPSKDELVLAFLKRRNIRMLAGLGAAVEAAAPPDRGLAVFDWMHRWFSEPGFRGCAWINAFGELGAVNPAIAAEVRRHKRAFLRLFTRALAGDGYSRETAKAVFLLAEGAIVTAAIQRSVTPAAEAKAAAAILPPNGRAGHSPVMADNPTRTPIADKQ
jgi:AcrR family transcriptional regulator